MPWIQDGVVTNMMEKPSGPFDVVVVVVVVTPCSSKGNSDHT